MTKARERMQMFSEGARTLPSRDSGWQAHHQNDRQAEQFGVSCSEQNGVALLGSLGAPPPLQDCQGLEEGTRSILFTAVSPVPRPHPLWNEYVLPDQLGEGRGRVRGGWVGRDPRIHWSSMLLRVKRVLENRAKPSR